MMSGSVILRISHVPLDAIACCLVFLVMVWHLDFHAQRYAHIYLQKGLSGYWELPVCVWGSHLLQHIFHVKISKEFIPWILTLYLVLQIYFWKWWTICQEIRILFLFNNGDVGIKAALKTCRFRIKWKGSIWGTFHTKVPIEKSYSEHVE